MTDNDRSFESQAERIKQLATSGCITPELGSLMLSYYVMGRNDESGSLKYSAEEYAVEHFNPKHQESMLAYRMSRPAQLIGQSPEGLYSVGNINHSNVKKGLQINSLVHVLILIAVIACTFLTIQRVNSDWKRIVSDQQDEIRYLYDLNLNELKSRLTSQLKIQKEELKTQKELLRNELYLRLEKRGCAFDRVSNATGKEDISIFKCTDGSELEIYDPKD